MPDGSRRKIYRSSGKIVDILIELGINPEEVIVARNGNIVAEEESVGSEDVLKIMRIVHGG